MFNVSLTQSASPSSLRCDEVLLDEDFPMQEPYKKDSLYSASPPLSPFEPSEWRMEETAKRIEHCSPSSRMAQIPVLYLNGIRYESLNEEEALDQFTLRQTKPNYGSENLRAEEVLEEEEESFKHETKKGRESWSLARHFCQICSPSESNPWYRSPLLFLNPQKVNYLLAIHHAVNTTGDINSVNQTFGFCKEHGFSYLKTLAQDPLTSIYLPLNKLQF